MTVFGLYLRDLTHRRTQSHGIVNYAVGLARALPGALAGDERLIVYANTEITGELGDLPSSVTIVARGAAPQGAARLYHDHVASVAGARRDGVDVLHFPKGFIPLANPTGVHVVATVHDDIPVQYWRGTWGRDQRTARTAYFAWNIGHAARRADAVLTVSEFTRSQLRRRWPGTDPHVTYSGVALPSLGHVPLPDREPYVLHFGSVLPHKRSLDGLRRMLRWLDEHPDGPVTHVRVTGDIGHARDLVDDPRLQGVHGPLSNQEVALLIARARLVLFPSVYEGFGLPPLEARLLGTPVVHARIPAVSEVLGTDAPGGYDADVPGSFAAAMGRALSLDDDALRAAAVAASGRFDWAQVAERTVQAYRESGPHTAKR